MNGAESLVHTLIDSGVEVCFSNPGTSEMHFVAALDKVAGMRCVLGLFEGVVTGAADGYYRMQDKPAATLLHLGPGLGNGLANLHNARKAMSGIVNIVGDHATYHVEYDAPLTADVEGIAKPVSGWVKTSKKATEVAADGAQAVARANTYPGQVATLILPANTAWETSNGPAPKQVPAAPAKAPSSRVEAVADVLRSKEPTAIVITGFSLRQEALETASKIAQSTGAHLFGQTSNARLERGRGRVPLKTVPYPVDAAVELLKPYKNIITVSAKAPVAFFAYPDKPSGLYPSECNIHVLAHADEDCVAALAELADLLNANSVAPDIQNATVATLPANASLTPKIIAATVAHLLPDNAIVIDESITCAPDFFTQTSQSAPHDWLQICGGSIGAGFPLATGAAVARPDRKVVALQADGSGMYTLQALWTQARENLDITTILLSNRAYAILKHELKNVGATTKTDAGSIAHDMMELNRPDLDWVSLAKGMGVEAARATDVTSLAAEIRRGLQSQGPYLIEAIF